jgi:hypothetical protein
MDYLLQRFDDHVVDVWKWVFEVLSVSHFKKLWIQLGFELPPSNALQTFAQEAVLNYHLYLSRKVFRQPSIQLIDLDIDHPLLSLWTNTFFYLDKLGYGDAVYQWGSRTHSNCRNENNQINHGLEIDRLLRDWASGLNDSFPFDGRDSLQAVILSDEAQYRQLGIQMKEIEHSPKNYWDRWVFNRLQVGAWIFIESDRILCIRKWNTIFDLLTPDEIKILENWLHQNLQKMGYLHFPPLVDFR